MPRIRINNELIHVNNLYYIGVDGLDSNDGTYEKPFKTYERALDMCNNGDGIEFLDGNYTINTVNTLYKKGYYNIPSSGSNYYNYYYVFAAFYDNNKDIKIICNNNVFIDIPLNNVSINTIFYFKNPNTKFFKGNIKYHSSSNQYIVSSEGRYTRNYFYHCNNISLESTGTIYNTDIEILDNLQIPCTWSIECNDMFFYNCNINTNNKHNYRSNSTSGSYKEYSIYNPGNVTYINCLVRSSKALPNNSNCLERSSIDKGDYDFNNLMLNDIKNKGNPNILNPDLSISNIGILGGPYSVGYRNYLNLDIKNCSKLQIRNYTEIALQSIKISIHKGPLNCVNYNPYTYSNKDIDKAKYELLKDITQINNMNLNIEIDLTTLNIPEGLHLLQFKLKHKYIIDSNENYYLLNYKGNFFMGKFIHTLLPEKTTHSPRFLLVDCKTDLGEIDIYKINAYGSRDNGETFYKNQKKTIDFIDEGTESDREIVLIATSNISIPPDRIGYFWI